MYPTQEKAEALLAEARQQYDPCQPDPWPLDDDHCRTAARCARAIAARCPGLDPDKAYVLGLLHRHRPPLGRRATCAMSTTAGSI